MERKKIILFVCVILIGLMTSRCYLLNKRYPNPKERVYKVGEEMKNDSFSITLQDIQVKRGEAMLEKCPELVSAYSYTPDEVGVVLIDVIVEKIKDTDEYFEFGNLTCESKAWGNGMELALFKSLNKNISPVKEEIAYKDIRKVTIPFVVLSSSFSNKSQWDKMEKREYSLVYSLYPEKIVFKL